MSNYLPKVHNVSHLYASVKFRFVSLLRCLVFESPTQKRLSADGIRALYVENILNGYLQAVLEKKTAFKGIYAQ